MSDRFIRLAFRSLDRVRTVSRLFLLRSFNEAILLASCAAYVYSRSAGRFGNAGGPIHALQCGARCRLHACKIRLE